MRRLKQIGWIVSVLAAIAAGGAWVAFPNHANWAFLVLLVSGPFALRLPRPDTVLLWAGSWVAFGCASFGIGLYLQAKTPPAGSLEWFASQIALAAAAFCLGVAANQVVSRQAALKHASQLAGGPLKRLDEELAALMTHALSWVRSTSHIGRSRDSRLIHALESFQSHAKTALTELASTFNTPPPGEPMAELTDHSTFLTCTGCKPPPNSFAVVIPAGRPSQLFTCVQCYHVLTLYRDNRLDVSASPLTRPIRSPIVGKTKDTHGRPTPILECENGHRVEAKVRGQGKLIGVCMTCHSAPTITDHQFTGWLRKNKRKAP